LVSRNAGLIVKDSEALDKVVPMIIDLAKDKNKQDELKRNIGTLAVTDADRRIARAVLELM
jgi:UDP-N-acetylglucosamine--N-acetylmuramyl-(pentapeptide) pyrophosphoryl-undecaprenol N-acetylglucosamine transferase